MADVTFVGGNKIEKYAEKLAALSKKKIEKSIRFQAGAGGIGVNVKATASGGDNLKGDLQRAHEEAMRSLAGPISDYLDAMMSAGWGWSDGARDIVDTGQLQNSGRVTVSGDNIVIQYSADYANLIHYGGYIQPYGNLNIEKVYIPGRPWISATFGLAPGPLPPFDIGAAYEDAFYRALR